MTTTQVISCPTCGAKNRVRTENLERGLSPRCGRCRAPLAVEAGPVEVTDSNFADVVERSSLPVLVDFWAEWCGPCRMIAPAIEQVATQMAGRVRVAKLNIDDNQRTAQRYGVSSIPALLMFKGGRVVDQLVGARPAREIAQWAAQHAG